MKYLRISIDCAMLVFFVLAMAYVLTGNQWHEVVGILLFALVLMHCGLNFTWFRRIFTFSDIRRLLTMRNLCNIFLALSFLTTIAAGVLISQFLFTFIPWEGGLLMRQIHIASAYWLLVFAALHTGLHWHSLYNRVVSWKTNRWVTRMLWGVVILLSGLGIHAFIVHEVHYKLILYYAFSFPDANSNGGRILLDHALMFVPFSVLAYCFDRMQRRFRA